MKQTPNCIQKDGILLNLLKSLKDPVSSIYNFFPIQNIPTTISLKTYSSTKLLLQNSS